MRRENKLSRTTMNPHKKATGLQRLGYRRRIEQQIWLGIGRQQSLIELLQPPLGALIARLRMAQMLAKQRELIAKFCEIALQPAKILNDLFSAVFDFHAFQA